jgi:Ser/Thr protein kinase RdoA (MazF antagonist)
VFPEEFTIVTEEAPGASLTDLITRSARLFMLDGQQGKLATHCAAAGAWLREFQSVTSRGVGDFDIEALVEYCDIRLDALAAAGCAELEEAFKDKFRTYLRATHERAKSCLNLIVGRHNDFSPHHVFVSQGRISVIDFGFFDHGSHLYDVCRFWFQLERLKLSPLCRTSVVDRLQESFFAGYGTSREACGPGFEMVASRYFLTQLASVAAQRRRDGIRGWMDRRSYRWCLEWLKGRCARVSG